ncbi:MAG: Cfr10I/Bse634I family restriction endonuclease, partial [Flavobacteriales bacterium]
KSLYRNLENSCTFEDIKGYISVKISLRPDRRLQIPHEGSLMKALYVHLQTRDWILNPSGLKYYAITTELSKDDRKALETVATHSITTVNQLPEPAVDEVLEVNSLEEAYSVFSTFLNR